MASTTHKKLPRTSEAYTDEYVALCTEFPLVKVETKAEFAKAGRMIDRLSLLNEDALTRAQGDYLDMLVVVYEEAERRFFGPELAALEAKLKDITGLDLLKHLAEASGMSGGDIGRLLGSRQLGNAILRGDRQISKTHAVKLGEYFKVDAGAFL